MCIFWDLVVPGGVGFSYFYSSLYNKDILLNIAVQALLLTLCLTSCDMVYALMEVCVCFGVANFSDILSIVYILC